MITDPFKRFARTGLTAHDGSYAPLLDVIDEDPTVVRAEHRFRRWTPYTDGSVDERSKALDVIADALASPMDSAAPADGPADAA